MKLIMGELGEGLKVGKGKIKVDVKIYPKWVWENKKEWIKGASPI